MSHDGQWAIAVPEWTDRGALAIELVRPAEQVSETEILGEGADAAPRIVALLQELGLA